LDLSCEADPLLPNRNLENLSIFEDRRDMHGMTAGMRERILIDTRVDFLLRSLSRAYKKLHLRNV
jgi:hypothetical protein